VSSTEKETGDDNVIVAGKMSTEEVVIEEATGLPCPVNIATISAGFEKG
jgi:hypothetical protein